MNKMLVSVLQLTQMTSVLWPVLFVCKNKTSVTAGLGNLLTWILFCCLVAGSLGSINGAWPFSAFVHMVFLWRETSPAAALHFSTGEQATDFLEKDSVASSQNRDSDPCVTVDHEVAWHHCTQMETHIYNHQMFDLTTQRKSLQNKAFWLLNKDTWKANEDSYKQKCSFVKDCWTDFPHKNWNCCVLSKNVW